MYERLIQYFEQYFSLSKQDKQLIRYHSYIQPFQQGELLLEAGKVPEFVGFVLSGEFRYFVQQNNGQEVPAELVREFNFVPGLIDLEMNLASAATIKAAAPSVVAIIDKASMEVFSDEVEYWDPFIEELKEAHYAVKQL